MSEKEVKHDGDCDKQNKYTAKAKFVSFTHDDVANLLTRLEAAEKFINAIRETWVAPELGVLIEDWRKTKGENI